MAGLRDGFATYPRLLGRDVHELRSRFHGRRVVVGRREASGAQAMGAGPEPSTFCSPAVPCIGAAGWSGAWRTSSVSLAAPRLSSRRGAARSGRASVGARLQGPPRCLALPAPRDPMGRCLAATPSAGPAHSTRQQSGRTQGHQLFLVRPPGHPGRLPGQRRARCSSWRGQALGSWCRQVPERARTQSHRSASPLPNDRQAHQLDPAVLPAAAPPCRPGRRANLRIRVDVDHPGFDQLRAAEFMGDRRNYCSGGDCLAPRRSARFAGLAQPGRLLTSGAPSPQPPVPWRWPARRRRRNCSPCSLRPWDSDGPPSRSRLVPEDQPELPRPMALPPLPDVAACRQGVRRSVAPRAPRGTGRDQVLSRTTPRRRPPADRKDRAAAGPPPARPLEPSPSGSDPQHQPARSNPSPRHSGPGLQHADRNPCPARLGSRAPAVSPEPISARLGSTAPAASPEPVPARLGPVGPAPRRAPSAPPGPGLQRPPGDSTSAPPGPVTAAASPESPSALLEPRAPAGLMEFPSASFGWGTAETSVVALLSPPLPRPPPDRIHGVPRVLARHRTWTLQWMLALRWRRRRSRTMRRLGDRYPVPRR